MIMYKYRKPQMNNVMHLRLLKNGLKSYYAFRIIPLPAKG